MASVRPKISTVVPARYRCLEQRMDFSCTYWLGRSIRRLPMVGTSHPQRIDKATASLHPCPSSCRPPFRQQDVKDVTSANSFRTPSAQCRCVDRSRNDVTWPDRVRRDTRRPAFQSRKALMTDASSRIVIMNPQAIAVFARFPSPGKVKTRLAATIGDAAACRFYQHCTEAVLRQLVQ